MIQEIKKILQSKHRFGPITANNLVSANSKLIEESKKSAEEVADELNKIYESLDEADDSAEEESENNS